MKKLSTEEMERLADELAVEILGRPLTSEEKAIAARLSDELLGQVHAAIGKSIIAFLAQGGIEDLSDEGIERLAQYLADVDADRPSPPALSPEESEAESDRLLEAIAYHSHIVFKRLGLSDVLDEWVERMKRK